MLKQKSPEIAEEMISKIVQAFSKHVAVKTGSFGAMMDVGLINDGPATFVLTARNGELIDQADRSLVFFPISFLSSCLSR